MSEALPGTTVTPERPRVGYTCPRRSRKEHEHVRPRLAGLLLPILAATTLAWSPLPGHTQAPAQVAAPPGVNLTPAQQARAQARHQKFIKDVTALQANKTMTPAQKNAKGQALVQSQDRDMLAILTPQQRTTVMAQRAAQMKNLQAQQKAAQAFQNAHKTQIAQGQALAKKLTDSLTPAQKTQIETVRQQFRTSAGPRMNQVMTNNALTPQAKQQQLMSIAREIDPKIEAVLNPTQRADYEKMVQLQKQLAAQAMAKPVK